MNFNSKVHASLLVLASVGVVALVYTLAPIVKVFLSALVVGLLVYGTFKLFNYLRDRGNLLGVV